MNFPNLYDYSTLNGVVIPETQEIKSAIENAFREIFGSDFVVLPETPQGRVIEALTLMFCDTLKVCAANANGFNPNTAVSTYLDNIGAIFGCNRLNANETDSSYRSRILDSQSFGVGFAKSLRRALSSGGLVGKVDSICILDNGNADSTVLPDSERGMSVDAHSVFICVGYSASVEPSEVNGLDSLVANEINNCISAGCGFTNTTYGTKVTKVIGDSDTASSKTIVFYHPTVIDVEIHVSISAKSYTGKDAVGDTRAAIAKYINSRQTNSSITDADIYAAIASEGSGLVCTAVSMYRGSSPVDRLDIKPYERVVIDPESDDQIEVDVV